MLDLVILINVTISPVKINIFRPIFKIIFHCVSKNNTLIIYDITSKALLDKTQSKCIIFMQSVVLNSIEQSSESLYILNTQVNIMAFCLSPIELKSRRMTSSLNFFTEHLLLSIFTDSAKKKMSTL